MVSERIWTSAKAYSSSATAAVAADELQKGLVGEASVTLMGFGRVRLDVGHFAHPRT